MPLPKVLNINYIDKPYPKDSIRIGRPSIFGNPFPINRRCTREDSLKKFQTYFDKRIKEDKKFKEAVLTLKTFKYLLCYCKPLPCHGDIYVKWLREWELGNDK